MLTFGELSVFASTAILFFFFLWTKRNGKIDDGKQYPPTSSTLSLFIAIIRGGITILPGYFMKTAEKLGPVFSYKFGGSMLIILNGKEAISEAFLRRSEAFADRSESWIEANICNPDARGIIFARYNATFKKHHKLCLSILKEFGFGVNSVSETRILREVESLKEKIFKRNGHPFDPEPLTVISTFNVVASILFGGTFVSSDSCSKIAASVKEFAKLSDLATNFSPIMRFVPYFRRKLELSRQCHATIINCIKKGIECSKSPDCESTFVRRFIEIQGPDYNQEDLLYIVRDLCFGSAETVSSTVQWIFVELANHPQVLTRLQREIDEVVGKDRLPSLDDKPRLPYTEAVIAEIMRRRTIVPFYVPHATFKDTELYGFHIPKGCTVMANSHSAHMDPQFWKDPENFRPERFLDEHHMLTGCENVIPFSLGKRSCLGEILGRQEVFLFFTSLVQSFDIRPPEGQQSINVKEIIGGVMQPSKFQVRLVPRTSVNI